MASGSFLSCVVKEEANFQTLDTLPEPLGVETPNRSVTVQHNVAIVAGTRVRQHGGAQAPRLVTDL